MPCPKLAEGEVVRLTRVDGCGAPVSGDDNGVLSECWASLQMSPNVNTGTDIEMIGMNGRSCAFKKACPDFRGYDVTATFFEASPEQIELLTGNPVYFDFDGNPIGWDDCSVACASGFAIELWQSILGQDCTDVEDVLSFYWLLPWLTNGILGDVTVNNEGLSFTLTASTRAGTQWDLGPWDVQAQDGDNTPGPLLTPLGSTCHRRGFITTVAAPTVDCGYVTVPPNNVS